MKRSWLILFLTFLITPITFYCAGKAVVGNKNDVADWLPANYEETSSSVGSANISSPTSLSS